MSSSTRILFIVSEDWYYWSHRRPIAEGALQAGYEVTLASRFDGLREDIEATGVRTVDIALKRTSTRPVDELVGVVDLVRLYRRLQPDVVHHVSIKPVLYGSIAARIAGVRNVVNAVPGLGYVFTGRDMKARVISVAARQAYRLALSGKGTCTILQNEEDRSFFVQSGITSWDKTALIRGSGVDTVRFVPGQEEEVPVIMYAGRMLESKGVRDLYAAHQELIGRGISCKLRLVGAPDEANPEAIKSAELAAWAKDAHVEWLGHRSDVADILPSASAFVLSSDREGVPKALLEAASCGVPIVASDVPGCRDVVDHGRNGFLVPVRSPRAIADALEALLAQPELRRTMDEAGRRKAITEFAEEIVVRQTLDLYARLLKRKPIRPSVPQADILSAQAA